METGPTESLRVFPNAFFRAVSETRRPSVFEKETDNMQAVVAVLRFFGVRLKRRQASVFYRKCPERIR